jgi:hypothetical protein
MRPPACTQCKWGPGTACEKPSSSGASKELEAKLKEMQQARTQQDVAWFAPPRDQSEQQQTVVVMNKTSGYQGQPDSSFVSGIGLFK